MAGADICFLATSKSGLGHLRRTASIARRMLEIAPDRRFHLISNARPLGLSSADMDAFDTVQVADRDRMADHLFPGERKVLVLDTVTVPGIERLGMKMTLVLREAPEEQLHRFRLALGQPWDLVIIANPHDHWMPAEGTVTARKITPVGWIYRSAGLRQLTTSELPRVLVATGGGGTAETAREIYASIDAVLAQVRRLSALPFEVVQAIGPRARTFGHLAVADRIVDPGAGLHALFRDADIVISTAGYNSVLELATTDTPTLLVPIARSIDDQAARARLWADRLGFWHDRTAPGLSADWLAQEIARRRRRPPIDLGPSGEDQAANAILSLG